MMAESTYSVSTLLSDSTEELSLTGRKSVLSNGTNMK
jgi:hypothetical protein